MGAALQPMFQELQDNCFDTILLVMGQPCSWTPSAGGATVSGLVLYNGPTTERQIKLTNGRGLSHIGYDNAQVVENYIEFNEEVFQALFDSVYAGGEEYVQVTLEDGTTWNYICRCDVAAKYDGQTYRVPIQLSEYQLTFSNLVMNIV